MCVRIAGRQCRLMPVCQCFTCHRGCVVTYRYTSARSPTWSQPPPGVSRFRCFCYYLGRPHARHGSLRHLSLPGVSRFRRIGSHLHRVTGPALWQRVASCGAFVLIMRRPASDAPLKRGICFSKIRGFKVADYKLNRILRPLKVFHRNPAENRYICAITRTSRRLSGKEYQICGKHKIHGRNGYNLFGKRHL